MRILLDRTGDLFLQENHLSCKCRGNMCNSAEQAGADQANEPRKDSSFTSESDLFIRANIPDGNGNMGKNSNDKSALKVCNPDQSSLVNDSCRPRTSEESCIISFEELKHIAFNAPTETGMMGTLPIDKEVMPKPVGLETEVDVIDVVKLDIRETRGDETADSIVSSEISDAISGQTPEVSEMPDISLEAGGQQLAAEAAEGVTMDVYKGDHSSVAQSVGEFEGHSDPQQNLSTSKHDVSSSQEVSTPNIESLSGAKEYVSCIDERQSTTEEMTADEPALINPIDTIAGSMKFSNTCQDTDINTVTCIAAGSQVGVQQIKSKSGQSEPATKEPCVIENLPPKMASSSEALALKQRLKEALQDSSIEIEQQEVSVGPQIVHALNIEGNNGPELAEFFSNARGSKHEVEIEEHDRVPIQIKSPPKRMSYKESPRSLRMLLFSDEAAPFTKKEEKYKRDGKGMEFSNKIVPAFEGIGGESCNEDINFPKWHEVADNVEPSTGFSGPLAFSGALSYQGLISYTGQVAYSGSISHRSDSSTSTRSFAFPILASEWSASPVKMGAPDPRFLRQQRKWDLCSCCCRRPSTLFD